MNYSDIVEQKEIDRLVTMHTSIARGDVWCKYQISPALPQGARLLTEEEEEDDDEKIQKSSLASQTLTREERVWGHCYSRRVQRTPPRLGAVRAANVLFS